MGRTIEKSPLGVKEKNHNIYGVRLGCSSEGNILEDVLIIRAGGYESRAGDFLIAIMKSEKSNTYKY